MGEVLAPYGIRGWVKVRTHTEEPAAMLGYPAWALRPPHAAQWQEWALVTGRMHAGTLVAQLSGVDGREAALRLKGWLIGVPRSAMPKAPPGEIYWADLLGLAVVNPAGIALGTVTEVTAHGAHPLLRVAPPAGSARSERMIPYVPAIILHVDADAGRIEVDWGENY